MSEDDRAGTLGILVTVDGDGAHGHDSTDLVRGIAVGHLDLGGTVGDGLLEGLGVFYLYGTGQVRQGPGRHRTALGALEVYGEAVLRRRIEAGHLSGSGCDGGGIYIHAGVVAFTVDGRYDADVVHLVVLLPFDGNAVGRAADQLRIERALDGAGLERISVYIPVGRILDRGYGPHAEPVSHVSLDMREVGKVCLRDVQSDGGSALEGLVGVEFNLKRLGGLGLVPVEVDVLAIADDGGHIGRSKAAREVKFLDERFFLLAGGCGE